jgi:coenzyme F420 hydrogenase subunit beta
LEYDNFMSAQNTDLFNKIIRHDLCNRCGSCVGLSGGKIVFSDKTGKYLPEIIEEPDVETMRKILFACTGYQFNFPEFNEKLFGNSPNFNVYSGSYHSVNIGFSKDETIRRTGASGGVLSSILIWLLEKGYIQGAVVTRMNPEEPWMTQTMIARNCEEILEAAQSKYIITSVNEILPEIEEFEGNLAYIGLPGQVQSIRKLQSINDPAVKNIKYVFGPFYGNTLHFSSIISFLRSYKEKDYKQIKQLNFRYGEWPGNMRIEMQNGRVIQLPKFHANYLIPFHILKNSLLCTDLSNEFTDISVGDAWAPVYEERGKGFSMIIVRSNTGKEIFEQMLSENLIDSLPIAEEEAIKMHSHGYDLKKRGTFIRMRIRELIHLPNTDYGYKLSGFTVKRWLMELIILSLFSILGTKLFIRLSELVPPATIGRLFEMSRKFWKRSTKSIKQKNL